MVEFFEGDEALEGGAGEVAGERECEDCTDDPAAEEEDRCY